MSARQEAEQGIATAIAAVTAFVNGDTFLANGILGSLEDETPNHRQGALGYLATTVSELLRCHAADRELDLADVLQGLALANAREAT